MDPKTPVDVQLQALWTRMKAREEEDIRLQKITDDLYQRLRAVEKENRDLRKALGELGDLKSFVLKLLEKVKGGKHG